MRKARLIVALFIVLAASMSAIAPVWAAPSAQTKLVVTAHGGFGDEGNFIIGEWFPVYVTLNNPSGGSNMRVSVEVDSQGGESNSADGTYFREVDLSSPSRKEITLYAYASSFVHSLDVRLMQGGVEIGRTPVKLKPLERAGNLIMGVVSSDKSLLNILKGESLGHTDISIQNNPYQPPTQSGTPGPAGATIAHIALADIPTLPMALDGLDIMVVDDIDTGALQVEQRKSLADWVTRGGMLVTTSRPGGADTLAGLADISPVTVSGTRNVSSLAALASLPAVPLTTTGSIVVPGVALKTGQDVAPRVLALQDGVPLLTARNLGRGGVMHLALSPGVAPLKGWDGIVPLFKRMLSEHSLHTSYNVYNRVNTYYAGYSGKVFNSGSGLFDMPGLQLPDPILIGLFLWIYIMIIGPLNFIILRRMRRSELAWITIPALVALFSLAAYVLAYQSKGGDLVAIRTTLVNTEAGVQRGTATQYLGLFSPQRRTYSLQGAGDAVVNEMNAYGYGGGSSGNSPIQVSNGGATTTVGNVRINTWSLRALMSESQVEAQSPLEADIHLGDNVIEGTVRNRSGVELHDVALLRGDVTQYIGTMASGQRADVKLPLSTRLFTIGSPTSILPLPPGVNDPTSQNSYPYYGGSINNDEQRAYNRKVEVLNMALQPFATSGSPPGMDVVALAWGPQLQSGLNLTGATAQNEELNIWTSHLPVTSGGNGKPVVKAGSASSVPFSIYAPGSSTEWVAGSVLNSTFIVANSRYADATYHLPSGAQPGRLSLYYGANGVIGDVDILARNTRTGAWDRLATFNSGMASPSGPLVFPNPKDYVDTGGDVMVRLLPKSGNLDLGLTALHLGLNETP